MGVDIGYLTGDKDPKSSAFSRRIVFTIAITLMLGTCVCFALFVISMRPTPENVCQGDSNLVVDGVTYSCEALVNEAYSKERTPGVFQRRHTLCQTNNNGCCQICQDVLKDQCVDLGLRVADGAYDCLALVNKAYSDSKVLGAYENNATLCNDVNHSGCCKTCQAVLEKASQCKDTGLTIADGEYDCKALIDKVYSDKKNLGAFKNNVALCSNPDYRRGCCKTCEAVLKNGPTCEDSGLNIAGGSYDCKALVDKVYSDIKNIGAYENNVMLCSNEDYRRGCCKTCQALLKDSKKHSDETNTAREGNTGDVTKQSIVEK